MQNTNTSLTYCLTTVGLDKSIGRAFLIFPAPHGPDRTRLRQMNKMARHKRCQRLQSATKWVETLRPKSTFWRFPDFEREKDSFSSPIPSMQCCATVRATFRKQETSQLWMEGTGEGCGFLCFWSYPIWVQCLNNFVADCLNRKSGHTSLRKLIKLMFSCWDVKPPVAFYLLCLTSSCLFENN